MKCLTDVYTPSRKPYTGLPDLTYPFHDREVLVIACGRTCVYRKKIQLDDDLGYIGLEARTRSAHRCGR
jgi:hypothetical protein